MAGLRLPPVSRFVWQLRRAVRIFLWHAGLPGVVAIVLVVLAAVAMATSMRLGVRAGELASRLSQKDVDGNERAVPALVVADGLAVFRAYLPPHDDIPDIVKRLLLLAEDHGLTFASGEYKAETEEGFVSYRMVLPVKGDAAAIQSFLLDALKRHPTLALESAAFRRGRIEAQDVEARLNFSLLTRLPEASGRRSAP